MSTVFIVALISGYLAGSIPTGVLLGHVVGSDPRQKGSGNIGASNVTRTLGKKWGALTLLVDATKGALPALIGFYNVSLTIGLIAGFAAIVGHCFPVWLKFKGGKGVATAFGVMLVTTPAIAIVCALLWITLVFFTRTPSIGSLSASFAYLVLCQFDHQPFAIKIFAIATLLLIVIRHHRNIRALRRGLQRRKARGPRPNPIYVMPRKPKKKPQRRKKKR